MKSSLKISKISMLVAASFTLSACGGSGGGGGGGGGDTKVVTPPPAANVAPTITGSPALVTHELEEYSFTPVAVDKDGDTLTFSASNLPSWLTINSSTGELSGTPTLVNSGAYDNIIITVSDGTETTNLAAFSLTVEDTYLITGVVVDGYIAGAHVFLDTNLNGKHDTSEPSSTSDATGKYQLLLTGSEKSEISKSPIRAYLGAGADDISRTTDNFADMPVTISAWPFKSLNTDKEITQVISPFTNLVAIEIEGMLQQLANSEVTYDDLAGEINFLKTTQAESYQVSSNGLFGDFLADNAPLTAEMKSRLVERAESILTEQQYIQSNTNDLDNDGIVNAEDADIDGDGIANELDPFPTDINEWSDIDGDFIGDNSDPDVDGDNVANGVDAFPEDPFEWSDNDSDGFGDNSDAFPNDSSEWLDTDEDLVGDNADKFPNDSTEWLDTDGDLIGDNSDPDIDGDGILNAEDDTPNAYDYKVSELTFSDPVMQSCVQPYANDYASAISSITCIDVVVDNLSDLAFFANLQYLNLPGATVNNWQGMSTLTQLKRVEVEGSNFADVSLFANFTALEYAGLAQTNVTDVIALGNINSLLSINLYALTLADSQYVSLLENSKGIQGSGFSQADVAGFYSFNDEYLEFLSNNSGDHYTIDATDHFTWTGKGAGKVEIKQDITSYFVVVDGTFDSGKAIWYSIENNSVALDTFDFVAVERPTEDYTFSPVPNVNPSSYSVCVGINETNQIGCSNYAIAGQLEILTVNVDGQDVELPKNAIVQGGGAIGMVTYGSCALFDNDVRCFGGEFPENPSVTAPTLLAVGNSHFCVAEVDSEVHCFGDALASAAPVMTNVTALVSGSGFSCAIDDSVVKCWGSNSLGILDIPEAIASAQSLYATNTNVCAIHTAGTTCWGDNEKKVNDVPELTNASEYLTMLPGSVCSYANQSITCWGQTKVEEYDEVLQEVIIVDWQENAVVPSFSSLPQSLSLGMGREHCALQADNKTTCFGKSTDLSYQPSQFTIESISWIQPGSGAICAGNATNVECKIRSLGGADDYQGGVYVYKPITFN
ncbi:putative Ig domain-containing protein [Thalassotalea fonticola]|uniref:non-specific serine/threonine protein kinase n=1 Tax=Thalassotalea fonticola TaxID=3065649 RepID=A0ABZ0GTX3_9GAMM|nr:putative Ig domain-containing protein [Colwelliaceae bacterium S1-1]